jgi:hypothetical protein
MYAQLLLLLQWLRLLHVAMQYVTALVVQFS